MANLAFRKKRSLNDEWSHMFTFDDLCAPKATRKLQRKAGVPANTSRTCRALFEWCVHIRCTIKMRASSENSVASPYSTLSNTQFEPHWCELIPMRCNLVRSHSRGPCMMPLRSTPGVVGAVGDANMANWRGWTVPGIAVVSANSPESAAARVCFLHGLSLRKFRSCHRSK